MTSSRLPEPPAISLEQQGEKAVGEVDDFLRLRRRVLVASYPDGTKSAPFPYFEVERRAPDAVVLCAHYRNEGERWVFLRSAVRPPLQFRSPSLPGSRSSSLWELPAGLVEPDEASVEGLGRCAARELREELGFEVPETEFRALGVSVYPTPGVFAERHFYFEVQVDPAQRKTPTLDGSALEHGGRVIALPVSEGLAACRAGHIEDSKTELGLRRLAEKD